MRLKGEAPQPIPRLSEAFFVPERKELPKGKYERIIVVSDLHGAKPDVLERIQTIPVTGEKKPSAVIFNGDLVGNPELEELQKMFYNGVVNHARAALSENPNMSDKDLLNYVGGNPPYDGFSLKRGFMSIRKKEMYLEGLDKDGLDQKKEAEKLKKTKELEDDRYIAREIRRYTEYVHYGHYVSNLPEDAVKTLAAGVKDQARLLALQLARLKEHNINVYINEGNWDPSPPFAFKRGNDIKEAIRLSPAEQKAATGFSTQEYFKEKGYEYFTEMQVVETDTAALVMLPFDQLVRFADMDEDAMNKAYGNWKTKLDNIKKAGKQVIVIQHGEVSWEMHNLASPQSEAKGEHKKVINGSSKINSRINPDEIIHGHFHDSFVDEAGKKQDIDTKYTVLFDNTPHIVGKHDHQEGDTVVTYSPLQHMSTLLIPYETDKRIHGFGGTRQPAYVSDNASL